MKTSASKQPCVTIVGAGLAGVFMAILLAKRGYKVEVYERSSEKQLLDYSSRRSFNITFYGYGITALKEAGVWEAVLPVLLPLSGAATQVTPHSKYIYSSFDFDAKMYFAVSRAELLQTLLATARDNPRIAFHFERRLTGIDRYAKTMTVENTKTKTHKIISCDVILGADGVNSAVRTYMQQGLEANHEQTYASWTYKQISFPASLARALNLHPTKSYTWSRKYASIIGHPQLDGGFGALMMVPQEGKHSFASLQTDESIKRLVTQEFSLLVPALGIITSDLLTNPESYFVSVRTKPWFWGDFMAVIGDAAHGTYPFFGQGTATAFGDCLEIVTLLEKHGDNWGRVFAEYQESRKKNTDIVCEMSNAAMELYQRCTKADYGVIYDKLESVLNAAFPKWFLPPLSYLIAQEPGRAKEYVDKHTKQRERLKYVGVPVPVWALKQAIALTESVPRFHTQPKALSS